MRHLDESTRLTAHVFPINVCLFQPSLMWSFISDVGGAHIRNGPQPPGSGMSIFRYYLISLHPGYRCALGQGTKIKAYKGLFFFSLGLCPDQSTGNSWTSALSKNTASHCSLWLTFCIFVLPSSPCIPEQEDCIRYGTFTLLLFARGLR